MNLNAPHVQLGSLVTVTQSLHSLWHARVKVTPVKSSVAASLSCFSFSSAAAAADDVCRECNQLFFFTCFLRQLMSCDRCQVSCGPSFGLPSPSLFLV